MTNITLDGLPAKTGTISDAGIIHYREGGVDKKMTVADFLTKISEEYSSDINTFLGAADKAAGRAALGIARRTTVDNTTYTILETDKVVAQIGTMSAARTFTLPAAADYPAGEELIIIDESGTVTNTNKITVSRASTDTIDGLTSIDILEAYGILRLISDGTSKWKISNNLIAIFRAHPSSNQSLSSGVAVKAQINIEDFDIGNYYDNSIYRYTPPAGYYQVNFGAYLTANQSYDAFIYLYKNGSLYAQSFRSTGTANTASAMYISETIYLNGTDYIEVYIQMSLGSAGTCSMQASNNGFSAFKIR